MHKTCCVCQDIDIEDLIYQCKSSLDVLAEKRVNSRKYGTPFNAHDKIKQLESYLPIFEDERFNILSGGKECLTCDKLQLLAEKTRKITASCEKSPRRNLKVDTSGVDKYIVGNPYCVSREKWEELAYRVCREFKLELTSVETKCDITFELIRKLIPCDIMVSIAVYKQQCDLGLKVTRNEDECKLDFEILTSEVPCDLDLKTYKTLIDNNFSYDIIRNVYENGCTIELDDSE
jgi:hypothetical protein